MGASHNSAMARHESLAPSFAPVLDICASYTGHADRSLLHAELRTGTADNHRLAWIASWSYPIFRRDMAPECGSVVAARATSWLTSKGI